MPPIITDIRDLLPGITPSCSNSDYWKVEHETLSPALREAGYTLCSEWYTAEGDSFGPLLRAIRVSKDFPETADPVELEVFYG